MRLMTSKPCLSHSLSTAAALAVAATLLLLIIAEPCAASKQEDPSKWSTEFSLAKPVVATRALLSESPNNAYHEPLAKFFAGEEAMDEAVRKISFMTGGNTFSPGRNEIYTVVARHMIIDKFVHDAVSGDPHGPNQVVILGAGFDSRANRFAEHLTVTKWFELDLPAAQQYKEEVLRNHTILDPKNIVRIGMDLTEGDWVSALEEAGWDPSAPTIYILEGLIYYMNAEQAASLLKSIPSVPKSRIIVTIVEESLQKLYERMGRNPWKTNLRILKKMGALRLVNYKLRHNVDVMFPQKVGLKVWVARPPARNLWDRIRYLFHTPCERVLEYEAV